MVGVRALFLSCLLFYLLGLEGERVSCLCPFIFGQSLSTPGEVSDGGGEAVLSGHERSEAELEPLTINGTVYIDIPPLLASWTGKGRLLGMVARGGRGGMYTPPRVGREAGLHGTTTGPGRKALAGLCFFPTGRGAAVFLYRTISSVGSTFLGLPFYFLSLPWSFVRACLFPGSCVFFPTIM